MVRTIKNNNIGSTKQTPKNKTAPPERYQVVYYQEITSFDGCCLAILSDVFNMKENEAIMHAVEATMTGRSIVFTSFKDVAETKMDDANGHVAHHHKHNPFMSATYFKCEGVN